MKGILFKPWKIKFIAEHPDMELMTRRVIKPQPICEKASHDSFSGGISYYWRSHEFFDIHNILPQYAPYHIGETVYIKEAWGDWVSFIRFADKTPPRDGYYQVIWAKGDLPQIVYLRRYNEPDLPSDIPIKNEWERWLWAEDETGDPESICLDIRYPYLIQWRPVWKSPMFTWADFARYFIVITDVRAERLQEIKGVDCLAEGVEPCKYKGYTESYKNNDYLVGHFATLWNSINKLKWEDNPWVWVYSFKLKA